MGLIDYLKSRFAGAGPAVTESVAAVTYKGFEIQAEPMPENGQFRVQGWITRAGQTHHFIRADLLPNHELCVTETLRKARVLIDQKGSGLFQ